MYTIITAPILFIIFYIFCWWKVFTKAGQKGWLTLIPILNIIVFLKIAEKSLFWIIIYFTIIFAQLQKILYDLNSDEEIVFNLIIISGVIFLFPVARSFTRKFGDDSFWATIGFIFLNPIYIILLAFDKKAIYKAKEETFKTID